MYLANPDNTVMSVQPRAIAAHTEFSRLLSEHGTFGLVALLVFIGAAVANLRRAVDARSRAVIAGLSAWSALFMMSAAMRILAPSFAFGIGFLGAAVPAGEGATDIVGAAPRVRSRARRSLRPLTVRQRPTVADAARVE
jgi:hypothetical protein